MPSILFVCTANICRSPMAMVLFRRRLEAADPPGTWVVGSAGTWARGGNLASNNGRLLMESWGMDLSTHRSRVVDRDMLHAADLILTMEKGHKEAITAEFPEIAGRVYLLTEMVGSSHDIHDPYGLEMEAYRETALEIDEYLSDGFEKILALARGEQG